MNPIIGQNSVIGKNVTFGNNVIINNNCIIEDNVVLGNDVFIDHNCIIRCNTSIGDSSTIGANCIIGEYQMDFFTDRQYHIHKLFIGQKAIIRSGSILYSGSQIGNNFQTGHQITLRENSQIGDHVSIGTLCDIQGNCKIGNYVKLHSNVHIGMCSEINDCVWIFPYVVLTNDPTPPSETLQGVHIHSFAIIATSAVILPGIDIKGDSLIGAGTVVTKNVDKYNIILGNPGQVKGDVRSIKDRITGTPHYPWRYYFDRSTPWQGYGFDNWFNTLDNDTKSKLFA